MPACDEQTDVRTDHHMATAYTTLALRHAIINTRVWYSCSVLAVCIVCTVADNFTTIRILLFSSASSTGGLRINPIVRRKVYSTVFFQESAWQLEDCITECHAFLRNNGFLANVNVLRYVCCMRSQFRLSSVVCRLSVCRLLSVTLVHPTQPVEIFGNFFHHTIAQGL